MNRFPKDIENIIEDYVFQLETHECWICNEVELDCDCVFICEHHRHAIECECEDFDEPMMIWISVPDANYPDFVFIGIESELSNYKLDIRNKGNGIAKAFTDKENMIQSVNYFLDGGEGILTSDYNQTYERNEFTLTLD